MKILVTGSKGFVGKNLLVFLKEMENVEIIEYDKDDEFSLIENNIEDIDFVFHLAGVNRPTDNKEFYEGNTDLTKRIVDLLNNKKLSIPLIFSSSIQAALKNEYGISKKNAEDYVINNYSNGLVYRFHNVFGKWCRPNYNSVVATFCNNIANEKEIQINDPKAQIELIYIDDICKEFVNLIKGHKPSSQKDGYCFISPTKKITLKKLADLLYSFKENMNSIYVPKTGDQFIKKMFATYVSYMPVEKMVSNAVKHEDDRGYFVELVRTLDSGQFSISTSKPGIIRGNHYHNTKMERFIVVQGKAKISFKHIVTGEYYEFFVDDRNIQPVMIPVGYTHKIENIGDNEMILILWCNELFEQKNPDTYTMEI